MWLTSNRCIRKTNENSQDRYLDEDLEISNEFSGWYSIIPDSEIHISRLRAVYAVLLSFRRR